MTLEFWSDDRCGKEPSVTLEFEVDSVYHCFVALQCEGYNPLGTARTADDKDYQSMMYTDPGTDYRRARHQRGRSRTRRRN